jgi:hypothetical protein
MRRVSYAAAVISILTVNVANGTCYETDTFQNCDDSFGSSYTIDRFGGTTIMTGDNAQTGSSRSQNSTTLGDTTFHIDRASGGNSWNSTDQRLGESRSGRQGSSSNRICSLLDRC